MISSIPRHNTEPLAKDNLGVPSPPLAKIIHGGVSCKIAAISATAAFPQRKKKEAKKKETLGRPVESAVAWKSAKKRADPHRYLKRPRQQRSAFSHLHTGPAAMNQTNRTWEKGQNNYRGGW